MHGAYLLALTVSVAGLATLDYRYRLAFGRNWRAALKAIAIMLLVFVVWDVLGIALNIFFIGSGQLLTGVRIGEFPLEELLFLALLNYSVLIVYRLLKRGVK